MNIEQRIKLLLSTIDNLTYDEIAIAVGTNLENIRIALFRLEGRGIVKRQRAAKIRFGVNGQRWVWRGNSGTEQCERCGQRAKTLIAGLGQCCFDSMSEKAVAEWDEERDRRRAVA